MSMHKKVTFVGIAVLILLSLFLLAREPSLTEGPSLERAVVLAIDNDQVIPSGVSPIGFQELTVEVRSGPYAGEVHQAANELTGALEYDSHYEVSDRILVSAHERAGQLMGFKAVDHHRAPWLVLLGLCFFAVLIVYARYTGLKAFFSFVASLFVIWRLYLPALLGGADPLLSTILLLVVLSGLIIFSVVGLTKRGGAAFLGTLVGMGGTLVLTLFFGRVLHLAGLTQPFASALLIQMGLEISLGEIFYAAILIGASGAAMDIAMDVSASMWEIREKRPDIDRGELFGSGLAVGRAVIGTMTTTLLLAYTGGFLTLMLLFASRDTTIARMINLKIVSAELMRTLIGSIGLVLVAPTTAAIAARWMASDAGGETGDTTVPIVDHTL